MIHASPYENYRAKDVVPIQSFDSESPSERFRVQYAGWATVQDSRVSLGVEAVFDPDVFRPGTVVQMWLFAYYKANCRDASPGGCVVTDFYTSSGQPRPGMLQTRLQTGVVPVWEANSTAAQFKISSFHMYPVAQMTDTLGYELHLVFRARGEADFSATAGVSSVWETLYGGQGGRETFHYPAVFPARSSYE